MPRCVICDHCSDIGDTTGARAYRWHEEEHGYVCSVCEDSIHIDLEEYGEDYILAFVEDEEGPEGLGSDEVLEDGDLEGS